MSDNQTGRLDELLMEQATSGLDESGLRELQSLLAASDVDPESYERAAAALDLGLQQREEECPPDLKQKLVGDAQGFFGAMERPEAEVRERPSGLLLPWLAVAAAILLAVLGWWPRLQSPSAPSLVQQWEELERASDVKLAAWQPAGEGAGAGGEVLWSSQRQQGLMRFRGLQPNDPSVAQYQLWIFDSRRDERFPVDGGVFDVEEGSGEVIVPIRAKLRVFDPTLFAVTVERPGGVVVSTRERIALTASVG